MKKISSDEEQAALSYIKEAVQLAKKATCRRSNCGSVIVKDNLIIGKGWNSPPGDKTSQQRCFHGKESYHGKVTDKTCCMHAEQRAIMDALRRNPAKMAGSRLYFIRLDEQGKPSRAGKPYCTLCSKMALDTGVREFVLWHKDGLCAYDTEEYNQRSFEFNENRDV
ncbi:hypothetical protein HYU22_05355 [Candidatus Woesearchaeota archaeon]|nr:hypothetical protein [Candidatus Woesearchaeota archaeon]